MSLLRFAESTKNRAVWREPRRKLLTLESFARTEEDGGRDLLVAARRIGDAELRKHLERHAEDEIRHAALFRRRAADLRGEHPSLVLGEQADKPYDLSRGRGADVDAHGFLNSGLVDQLGEVDYVAMLHVAEARAAELFEMHRELSRDDAQMTALFDVILKDEKYHCAYTQRFLEKWRAEGRGRDVDEALKRARGSRLLGAWKRLGLRAGAGFSRVLLYVFYYTLLVPFSLKARGSARGAGWRTAAADRVFGQGR